MLHGMPCRKWIFLICMQTFLSTDLASRIWNSTELRLPYQTDGGYIALSSGKSQRIANRGLCDCAFQCRIVMCSLLGVHFNFLHYVSCSTGCHIVQNRRSHLTWEQERTPNRRKTRREKEAVIGHIEKCVVRIGKFAHMFGGLFMAGFTFARSQPSDSSSSFSLRLSAFASDIQRTDAR